MQCRVKSERCAVQGLRHYPEGTQVLHQLLSVGHSQQHRADPLAAQAPRWRTSTESSTHGRLETDTRNWAWIRKYPHKNRERRKVLINGRVYNTHGQQCTHGCTHTRTRERMHAHMAMYLWLTGQQCSPVDQPADGAP